MSRHGSGNTLWPVAGKGCPRKGALSRAGGKKSPAVPVVALYVVLHGMAIPKKVRDQGGGTKRSALLVVARRAALGRRLSPKKRGIIGLGEEVSRIAGVRMV